MHCSQGPPPAVALPDIETGSFLNITVLIELPSIAEVQFLKQFDLYFLKHCFSVDF